MSPLVDNPSFRIPGWVRDLSSFRRWATSDEFPDRGRISHLKGDLWVDLSMETLVHNLVKFQILVVLNSLVELTSSGQVLTDGMLLSHPEAELSTEPDGMYFSNEALERQRVQLLKDEESLEVIGSPEMVLEVVSKSSVQKDTVLLPELYWKAGVEEYWLVDPRGKEVQFDLLRRGAKRFTAARKQDGWMKSPLFQKSFRLVRRESKNGLPEFTLESR
jgi:Uma2 family endonuclease